MKVEAWGVATVIVGVVIYVAIPVALAVVYVRRAYATLRGGIPVTSGSSWLGLTSAGMRPSDRGTSGEGTGDTAGADGGHAG